jgi:ribosomal-protein-alanine N-acetyltransferase
MILIRAATAADLPRMKEIAGHAATAAQWRESEYAKLFAPEMQQSRLALVIEDNGAVCGFIVTRQVDYEWEIENIAVSGPARRRGLATRLAGEFIDLARNRGGQTVYLEVRESNRAARLLYEKLAFEEAGRRKAYYSDPEEDAVIFRLSLP